MKQIELAKWTSITAYLGSMDSLPKLFWKVLYPISPESSGYSLYMKDAQATTGTITGEIPLGNCYPCW